MTQLAVPTRPSTHHMTRWDRAAIAALGTAGFALSYDALQQMALAIHVRGPLTYLFPLLIDGFIAYGIRALIILRTAPYRARLYAWTLFGTATAASVWANALHAVRLNQQTQNSTLHLGDATVGVLSTLAPLALAGAVHLYILITRQTANTGPRPAPSDFRTPTPEQRLPNPARDEEASVAMEHAARPSEHLTPPPPIERTTGTNMARQGRPPAADFEEMLPIARKAAAEHGRLSRQIVRTAVRSAGLSIGDERLTALMARLRAERSASTR